MEENFSDTFLAETGEILKQCDRDAIERCAVLLRAVRDRNGRLFILGVGGSAGSASHATNDFRKLANMEAYCPSDNVSELTARVNDEGWGTVFEEWLKGSRLDSADALLIFSVGGGNAEKNVSANIVNAINLARERGASILGVVGRDGGYTARNADACVIIPTVNASHVTPHTEAFHGIIWHLLVSHPLLKANPAKWESLAK